MKMTSSNNSLDEKLSYGKVLYADVLKNAEQAEAKAMTLNYFQIGDATLCKFRSGDLPFVVIPNALPDFFIDRLQLDSKALELSGFGQVGVGVGRNDDKTKSDSIRNNVHQTWLQSCHESLPLSFIGDIDIRKDLFRAIEELRSELAHGNSDESNQGTMIELIDKLHPSMVELSYLSYQSGSYYKRHIDTFQNKVGGGNQRVVSLILYLGSDDDRDMQWTEVDGGNLRIFTDNGYKDVVPHPGTLVIFSSSTVAHEVLETRRSRRCIVGWFNAPSPIIEQIEYS